MFPSYNLRLMGITSASTCCSGLYLAAGNLLRVDGGWAARAGRRIRLANVGSRPRVQDSVLAAAAGADDCEGIDFAARDDPRDTPCTRTCIHLSSCGFTCMHSFPPPYKAEFSLLPP